jgi:hypothetical protein
MSQNFGQITAAYDTIYSRYDPSRFIGRTWLVDEVEKFKKSTHRRQMIIVGEPGSGKSAFMAYLAETWNCPRHFIRVDNIGGVLGTDPRSFLVSIGSQLYQKYGRSIFDHTDIGTTRVESGWVKDGSEVVGRFVDELYTLPFLPPQERDISVRVAFTSGKSRVIGEHVKRLIDVSLALDETALLRLTMIDPLRKLQMLYPQEEVLILIDALDEAHDHPGKKITDAIPYARDADFPSNLHLLMTSRPGNYPVPYISEDVLELDTFEGYIKNNEDDIRAYIRKRISEEPIAEKVKTLPESEVSTFETTVIKASEGNFLYVYHYLNAVAEAFVKGRTSLGNILIPQGLDEIYRVFAVDKIRKGTTESVTLVLARDVTPECAAQCQSISEIISVQYIGNKLVITANSADQVLPKIYQLLYTTGITVTSQSVQHKLDSGIWETKYLPILGILAVAYEPLSPGQLARFAGVEEGLVYSVIFQLLQFLDTIEKFGESAYRLYHNSFRDYLLDIQRNRDYPIDRVKCHESIASCYPADGSSWNTYDEYGLRHLTQHLLNIGESAYNRLYSYIHPNWRRIQLEHFLSDQGFLQDVDRALEAARRETGKKLPRYFSLSLMAGSIRTKSNDLIPEAIGAMVALGQEARANAYLETISEPGMRAAAALQMARVFWHQGSDQRARKQLDRAYTEGQTANVIFANPRPLLDDLMRWNLIDEAATTLNLLHSRIRGVWEFALLQCQYELAILILRSREDRVLEFRAKYPDSLGYLLISETLNQGPPQNFSIEVPRGLMYASYDLEKSIEALNRGELQQAHHYLDSIEQTGEGLGWTLRRAYVPADNNSGRWPLDGDGSEPWWSLLVLRAQIDSVEHVYNLVQKLYRSLQVRGDIAWGGRIAFSAALGEVATQWALRGDRSPSEQLLKYLISYCEQVGYMESTIDSWKSYFGLLLRQMGLEEKGTAVTETLVGSEPSR